MKPPFGSSVTSRQQILHKTYLFNRPNEQHYDVNHKPFVFRTPTLRSSLMRTILLVVLLIAVELKKAVQQATSGADSECYEWSAGLPAHLQKRTQQTALYAVPEQTI